MLRSRVNNYCTDDKRHTHIYFSFVHSHKSLYTLTPHYFPKALASYDFPVFNTSATQDTISLTEWTDESYMLL